MAPTSWEGLCVTPEPISPWCSQVGPYPGKLRHRCVPPSPACEAVLGICSAVGSFPLYPIGMSVEGRNVLGEQGQGSDLPLHPPPKPRPSPMVKEPPALRGDQRQQIPPTAPWKQNSPVGASQNPSPEVTQGRVWGVGTPGTPGGSRAELAGAANAAGWVGSAREGLGRDPPLPPGCPSPVPTQLWDNSL